MTTVPDDAARRAAIALHDRDCPLRDCEGPALGYYYDLALVALTAAAPLIEAEIYDRLGHDHYVIFTDDGWSVEHSVECRLSGHMHECEIHRAIGRWAEAEARHPLGRWRFTGWATGGVPVFERADAP